MLFWSITAATRFLPCGCSRPSPPLPQSEKEDEILSAVRACNRLFGTLLEKGELFVGKLPEENEPMIAANYTAEDQYKMWMRHRYNSCVCCLLGLMAHESFQVKESAMCTLMKFVSLEGKYPLVKVNWEENYNFPRELLKDVVESLLPAEDTSLLISRFQEFLDYDDVRYYVMTSVSDNIARVMQKSKEALLPKYQQNVFSLISSLNMPSQESDLSNFMVKQQANHEEWKVTKLKEHRRAFERVWLGFLKHKLPSSLYKKVLVILHDSILPHLSKPALMIDFLTAAYEIGGAISLLALNGMFVLIHQHNLEYPDFYKKLYSLLDPSVFHVKYQTRFFYLTNLFLSSTHLPLYVVSAFAKRLARLSLTAPPQAQLMVIPFICNLIRRHPACRVLIHRPLGPHGLTDDPYIMEEEDPSKSRALESSLWELQALQKHYHPDVAKEAGVINHPLSDLETDVSELLDISSYELFDREVKKKFKCTPVEFEPVRGLFGKKKDICAEHFVLL
ncbi:nucleolar complex protein 4 homolog isoform X2 [Rhinatrema bivittatum]|uniref:nucleolar complex protein 4 homolog isoform X2 n=1 Tax=Rhinatrema bivittatum TaxID=194408 RepID=UPI00112D5475|nr:nucleolar complex protein 4 homolog isoform X2 [Rhinatrema bivittatum]